jgi:hypothetical protein
MMEMRNVYKMLVRKTYRKDHLRPRHKWRIILKCILQKQSVKEWTGFNVLRTGQNSGICCTAEGHKKAQFKTQKNYEKK